jgi:hypothetical protein
MKSTLTRCLLVVACCWSVSASAQSDPTDPGAPLPPDVQGECSADSDCPTNFTCETDNFESCPPCANDGSDCTSTCSGGSYSYCMPPPPTPCVSDVNCDGEDVCVSYTYEACSGSSVGVVCADGETCPEPTPQPEPSCEAQTEAYCVPRYVAPCQAAADCGPGFTCEAIESCACSGGAVSPNNSTDPIEPCVCEPSGELYCQVIIVECNTDADCAQDLECISGPSETTVSVDPDGSVTPEPAPAPVSYCLPPGYGYWGGTSGADVVAQESGANGDLATTDRVSWGTNPSDGGSGSKGSTASCATIEGDAALSLLGLFGLVGFFRRRR